MKKERNICTAYNKPSAKGASGVVMFALLREKLKCGSIASVFENGKWYCKRHAPSKVKEREVKSWDKYINKIFK